MFALKSLSSKTLSLTCLQLGLPSKHAATSNRARGTSGTKHGDRRSTISLLHPRSRPGLVTIPPSNYPFIPNLKPFSNIDDATAHIPPPLPPAIGCCDSAPQSLTLLLTPSPLLPPTFPPIPIPRHILLPPPLPLLPPTTPQPPPQPPTTSTTPPPALPRIQMGFPHLPHNLGTNPTPPGPASSASSHPQ